MTSTDTEDLLEVYIDQQENLNENLAAMPLLLDLLEEFAEAKPKSKMMTFYHLHILACERCDVIQDSGELASEHLRALHLAFSGYYPENNEDDVPYHYHNYDMYDSSYLPFLISYLSSMSNSNYQENEDENY